MSESSAVWALSKVGNAAIDPLMDKMDNPEKNAARKCNLGIKQNRSPRITSFTKRWEVRIGKEAMEGEDETSSVDIDNLVAGGKVKLKNGLNSCQKRKRAESKVK